ncbi:MAG: hypothetical protein ACJA2S_002829 [Cyclobacteriaceae bacterium]|jgi:hypothetical protein
MTKEKTSSNPSIKETYGKGSFGYDLDLLGKHKEIIVLKSKDEQSQLVICPEYQGRVMTSTAQGLGGTSFGWLNHDLIASGEMMEHFNPIGGEERFWLGPEGGQFSIYFKPEASFDFENWYVPKEIDTESFKTVSTANNEAVFEKDMVLRNYSNTEFRLNVKRKVTLLDKSMVSVNLDTAIPANVALVGFESENILTNKGENAWDKNSGMLSIWILSMLNPSPETTVVIPFKKGSEDELGKIVTDDYFGKVPAERLVVKDGVLFFKADGRLRAKIGISPQRALPISGSYDATNGVLTIAQFTIPENNTDYVNSLWEIQEEPFEGDAVNAYNDGPLEDGGQLGPFYEIESSSPAAALSSGESLTHVHRTYHFKGSPSDLNDLAVTLLAVDIATIEGAFKNL